MRSRFKPIVSRLSPLLFLLTFALIPYGWFAEQSPPLRRLLYGLFSTEIAHAVGHALIFMAVGIVLLSTFPGLLHHPWRYFGLILLTGLAQEGFQLLYKNRGVVINDITDIGIDLTAAALVFALAWLRARHQEPQAQRADGML